LALTAYEADAKLRSVGQNSTENGPSIAARDAVPQKMVALRFMAAAAQGVRDTDVPRLATVEAVHRPAKGQSER
jgi:hypothetical protein